jgi:hypothetical protein
MLENRLPDQPVLLPPPVEFDPDPYPSSPDDFVGPIEAEAGGTDKLEGFFPYAGLVPTDEKGNAKFRKHVREVWTRPEHRAKLMEVCRRDILFWIHGFVSIRRDKPDFQDRKNRNYERTIPFLLWPRQVWVLGELMAAIGESEDIFGEKPREVGLTWLCEMPFVHDFLFDHDVTHMMFANKKDNVDGPEPNALLRKFDFIVENLPEWMVGEVYLENKAKKFAKDMYRHNPQTNVTIVGKSTTKDVGRMDRYQRILLDEAGAIEGPKLDSILAGTEALSWTRIIISTPPEEGEWHPYSRLRHTSMRKITLTWKDDPRKAEGLYVGADGKESSPWMDAVRARPGMTAKAFAREYMLDYGGISGQYYPRETLARIKEDMIEHPQWVGDVEIPEMDPKFARIGRFTPSDMGRMKLWCRMADGKAPRGRFGIAADIAAGSADAGGRGASNSTCGAVDLDTGQKVMEYKIHGTAAHKFAVHVAAIYRWFEASNGRGPETIWENNGPGNAAFGRTLIEDCGVSNYWTDPEKPKATPGWFTTGGKNGSRGVMFADHLVYLDRGIYIERSYDTLMEMSEYDHAPDDTGGAVHKGSKITKDLSEARSNHGDLVIMTTLLVQLLRRYGNKQRVRTTSRAPFMSQAWCEEREQEAQLAGVY